MTSLKSLFIEAAELKDVSTIAEFQMCHADEIECLRLDSMRVMEGVARVIEDHHLGFYLVARHKTALGHTETLGTLLVTKEWSDWRAKYVWWIQSAYVRPEFRGQGVFSALFRHTETEARAQDVAGLRLYVDHSNANAQAIYKKLGLSSEHYAMFEKMF